jgi:hypothetical protein
MLQFSLAFANVKGNDPRPAGQPFDTAFGLLKANGDGGKAYNVTATATLAARTPPNHNTPNPTTTTFRVKSSAIPPPPHTTT